MTDSSEYPGPRSAPDPAGQPFRADADPHPSSAPPAAPARHPDALKSWPYHQALRAAKPGWWRGLLAIISLVVAFLLLSVILGAIAIGFDLSTGRVTLEQVQTNDIGLSPAVMLANNVSLAALIPVAMLLQWGFFGLRPRFLSSVVGGFRWKLMARQALIVVPIWVVYVGLSFALSPPLPGETPVISADAIALAVIVLLTTPLQSAGEEYGARGLINRSAASWSASPRVAFALGAIVSSALFATAHLAGDPWLIAYYAVFGFSMCLVTTWSGGLEGSTLIHAVNNVLLLVPTVLMGQGDSVFDRQEGTGGPEMIVPMIICLGAAVLVGVRSRRLGAVSRTTPIGQSA